MHKILIYNNLLEWHINWTGFARSFTRFKTALGETMGEPGTLAADG
jgi:hypothetical protein